MLLFSAFAALVIEKIAEKLYSESAASLEVKLRLLNVVANFRESFAITKSCMEIGHRLLARGERSPLVRIAIYNALTRLASRNSLAVSEQVREIFRVSFYAIRLEANHC